MTSFCSVFLLFLCCEISNIHAWGNSQKVKLDEVKTLTLHHGKLTTARRTKAVPQLQCVGGTAGCGAFIPQVVQCYNRGSDGFDAQWECKTDMDTSYRFGKVDVVCEGYDYPDDPYILKGSCGLEYSIDLTEEGLKKKAGHNYYGSGSSFFGGDSHSYQSTSYKVPKSSGFGDLILYAVVLLLIYGIYKTCLRASQRSPVNDDFDTPDDRYRSGFGYPSAPPPPPGFRPSYTPNAGCGASSMGAGAPGSSAAGGFWSGAATGGLLGYMFGSRNRGYQQGYMGGPSTSTGWSTGSTSRSSFTPSTSSSGTRTASGFGGTKRR